MGRCAPLGTYTYGGHRRDLSAEYTFGCALEENTRTQYHVLILSRWKCGDGKKGAGGGGGERYTDAGHTEKNDGSATGSRPLQLNPQIVAHPFEISAKGVPRKYLRSGCITNRHPVGVHHKKTSGRGASQRPLVGVHHKTSLVGVHHKKTSGRSASQIPLVGVHHKQTSGRGASQTDLR